MANWRRRTFVSLLWLATTSVAVLVAWLALRPVLAAALPDAAVPLPATALPQQEPSASEGPADSATSRPEPGESVNTVNGWIEVDEGVWERSFHTEGGNATLRAEKGEVTLVSAVPADGYSLDIQRPAKSRTVVRFFTSEQTVTIDAMWFSDGPYGRVDVTT